MDINRLQFFLDAAQTSNFTETAQRLHVSQSTVSKYIGDLEKELNVTLFDRTGARLRLSWAGDALIPWARQLVRESERFREMARALQKDIAGQLRIACTTAAGKYILPMLAIRFRNRFPSVDVSILACQPPNAVNILRCQQADLAVVSFEISSTDMECQVFFYDNIILIAPPDHPWVSREEIRPDDLLEESMIIREPTSGTRRAVLAALASHDISQEDLKIILELANAEAIVSAVASGFGVAFVSHASANFALEAGCVKEVPVRAITITRKICMLRSCAQPISRPAEIFWGFIHEPENAESIRKLGR